MQKVKLYLVVFLFLTGCFMLPVRALAYQPELVYLQSGDVQIKNPETSQVFYDQLKGKPRDYYIDSKSDFQLYINLLVPEQENRNGRYSANIFLVNGGTSNQIASIDGTSFDWQESYNSFDRDYYLKGPEFSQQVLAGKYKIEIYSKDNQGKYVLAVGQKDSYSIQSVLNIYWQLPVLKLTFFKTSALQFFLTPFGIAGIAVLGAILVILLLISYFINLIRMAIKHSHAKTLLLTSNGMQMKEEIMKLLQKPAYDVTVAFITTASKPQENKDYVKRDWTIMKEEMGFNVEEVDIEGKKEKEVEKLLELKDIIFVEGGNAFYLLKAMRACNFEKIIRKFLKLGKVYIGVSAGSIVAGRNIQPAVWRGEVRNKNKNTVGLRNLKGLNLVPLDIVVHYNRNPEIAEIIRKKMPFKWQRRKLKIITDEQAILVQGREVDLIGKGEAVVL